ncbi:MAG: hypothetical protein IT373_34340 [Polyangiaceae bacterium]|nr:hypothetical protein [Polyangiaceae bacterium]
MPHRVKIVLVALALAACSKSGTASSTGSGSAGQAASSSTAAAAPRPPEVDPALLDGVMKGYAEVGAEVDAAAGDCKKLGELLAKYLAAGGAGLEKLLGEGGGADKLAPLLEQKWKDFEALDEKLTDVLAVKCASEPAVAAAAKKLGYGR